MLVEKIFFEKKTYFLKIFLEISKISQKMIFRNFEIFEKNLKIFFEKKIEKLFRSKFFNIFRWDFFKTMSTHHEGYGKQDFS